MKSKKQSYPAIFAVLAILSHSACVQSPEQKSYEDESKSGSIARFGGGSGGARLVRASFSLDHKVFGLMSTAATAYSVTLTGCLSGYGATVTETNLDGVEVYKDDRNCLAKMTGFTAGGTAYSVSNPGATDFSTWLANDSAYFTSAGGATTIAVRVISQLNSPISGTEAVVYQFSELLDGTGDYIFSEASVSDPHIITVASQQAPRFTIIAATYVGADDITGAPEMTFRLECVDDPSAVTPLSVNMTNGVGSNTLCGANELSTISYKLVKDTYTSTLDLADAEAIFATAGATVSIPGDQYVTVVDSQEGFNTSTLDGPGPLGTVGNENMILILKAGISFTYFNVDITTITQ